VTNREIVVASIASLFFTAASAVGAGYHCNVHENRQIYPSRAAAESGTPAAMTISLRNECFAETSQRMPWPICQSINEPARIYSERSNPGACAPGYI
jgi:hypothetical protein